MFTQNSCKKLPNSPAHIIESALSALFQNSLAYDSFLDVLEDQFRVVSAWSERVEKVVDHEIEVVRRVKNLGRQGTDEMLDALELIHEAACEKDYERCKDGVLVLGEGHRLIVESLDLCTQAEESDKDRAVQLVGDFIS